MRRAFKKEGQTAVVQPLFMWLLLALLIPSVIFCSTCGVDAAGDVVGIRRMSAGTAAAAAAGSWRSFAESMRAAKPHLIAAAAARFVSISACYPLDTIKTRLQIGSAAAAAVGNSKGGIAGLYSGIGGSLFGQVPYGMLSFGTYEMYKSALLKRYPEVPQAVTFCAAAILGDITGSLWLTPSEVVKVQMQGGIHASFGGAVLSIFQTSGVRGFYQGLSGQVVRDVPFRAIQLTSYELLRTLLGKWREKSPSVTTNHHASSGSSSGSVSARGGSGGAAAATAAENNKSPAPGSSAGDAALLGGVAGAISATITCPLDVIRTRLMVGTVPGVSGGGAAVSWAEAIKAGGLFAGIGTRVFYIGTSSAVFFVVYEAMKKKVWSVALSDDGGGRGGGSGGSGVGGGVFSLKKGKKN